MWYFRKMQWIVDSGGTKASWISENGDYVDFKGVNPNVHTRETIESALNEAIQALKITPADNVVWYGAGCSSSIAVNKLKLAFETLHIHCVEIQHDLMAAARAVLGNDTGIVGILGTGSNACAYNGERITQEKISLGYVMGDEGGAAYFGKRVLKDFIDGTMPEAESVVFKNTFGADKQMLVAKFYENTAASAHLGSYAVVLDEFGESSNYRNEVLATGFRAYKKLFLEPLLTPEIKKIGFVGTVASIYEKQLKQICNELNLEFVGVSKNPIDKLLMWHKHH